MKKNLDQNGYAGAVLIDLLKAFDTLNHDCSLAKLHAYGFNRDSLKVEELLFKQQISKNKN